MEICGVVMTATPEFGRPKTNNVGRSITTPPSEQLLRQEISVQELKMTA